MCQHRGKVDPSTNTAPKYSYRASERYQVQAALDAGISEYLVKPLRLCARIAHPPCHRRATSKIAGNGASSTEHRSSCQRDGGGGGASGDAAQSGKLPMILLVNDVPDNLDAVYLDLGGR